MQGRYEVRQAMKKDIYEWAKLRQELWPSLGFSDHQAEIAYDLMDHQKKAIVAIDTQSQRMIGFCEASLRSTADGCVSSPVCYIEGWYVIRSHRRQGIGGRMMRAVGAWGQGCGCQEMASDAISTNKDAIRAHKKLGFTEGDTVVYFHRRIS